VASRAAQPAIAFLTSRPYLHGACGNDKVAAEDHNIGVKEGRKTWTLDALIDAYRHENGGEDPSDAVKAQYRAFVLNPAGAPPLITVRRTGLQVALTMDAFANNIKRIAAQPKRKTLQPTALGKPMNVPDGTGFGISMGIDWPAKKPDKP